MEFPDSLSPAAVETLEKVLPGRPVTEFDGEEEESMLEVSFVSTPSLHEYDLLVVVCGGIGGEA